MNRRGALVTLGLSAFGGMARSIADPPRPANPGAGPVSKSPAKSSPDDRLREDIARLGPRVYSEEGIPVFLACEDLVPAKTSSQGVKVELTALNAALAAALHRDAEAFQRIRPDAQGKDIAALVEVLADRDFAAGGTAG